MRPLSAAWDAVLEARARRYADGRFGSRALPRPTVSVGNVTVGGTGKTPFVMYLAQRFLADGRRPAILSRGYGRRSRGVVVVSSGTGPRVGPAEGGDEPVLLSHRIPEAIVVVAPRRSDAADAALEFAPDLFLLDDGFQHLAVRRDLDLLLLDTRDPFGGGRYPPFGRLREPLSALRRADGVIWTHADDAPLPEAWRQAVARETPQFTARDRITGFFDERGENVAGPSGPSVAVSGIARPDSFRKSLSDLGVIPTAYLEFPDHHEYGARDGRKIRLAAEAAAAAAGSPATVITTEKDAVKLTRLLGQAVALRVVRLAVEVREPGFWELVQKTLFPSPPPGTTGGKVRPVERSATERGIER